MKFKPSTLLSLAAGVSFLFASTLAYARSDANFMEQAAQNGNAEIAASKLAQAKAKRPEVKAFADKMVTDHMRVADELKQLAASKKVDLPIDPSVMQKGKLKMIEAGSDDKFDERYIREFGVKAHEETLRLFETAAQKATDADVKAFAQKTLPALQDHLEMARKLAGGSTAAAGKSSKQMPSKEMRGETSGNTGAPVKP
jgi:putative membrane protein